MVRLSGGRRPSWTGDAKDKKKDGLWCWIDLGMVAPCQVRVELKACEELTAGAANPLEKGRREEDT